MLSNDLEAIALMRKVSKVYVAVPVVGELFYGAEKSARKQENMMLFEQTLSDFELLPTTKATAACYAKIKNKLVKSGHSIPDNDIWIAASACEHGLPVATFDGHFSYIEEVELLK
jgi:predicted nucleic acid-binding protein